MSRRCQFCGHRVFVQAPPLSRQKRPPIKCRQVVQGFHLSVRVVQPRMVVVQWLSMLPTIVAETLKGTPGAFHTNLTGSGLDGIWLFQLKVKEKP